MFYDTDGCLCCQGVILDRRGQKAERPPDMPAGVFCMRWLRGQDSNLRLLTHSINNDNIMIWKALTKYFGGFGEIQRVVVCLWAMKKIGPSGAYMTDIQFPYGKNLTGQIIHISEVSRLGESYECFCGEELRARALDSKKMQRHFFHLGERPPECSEEYRLHEVAKRFICDGLNRGNYRLQFPCSGLQCENIVESDYLRITSVKPETSVVGGTRSDIFVEAIDNPFILEVIVTHDIGITTERRYKEGSYPVFKVYPTLETLLEFHTKALVTEDLDRSSTRCPSCIQADKEEKRHQQVKQAEYRRMMTAIDQGLAYMKSRDPKGYELAMDKLRSLGFRRTRGRGKTSISSKYRLKRAGLCLYATVDLREERVLLSASNDDGTDAYKTECVLKARRIIYDKYPSINVIAS